MESTGNSVSSTADRPNLRDCALAISGALNAFDIAPITGRGFWQIYGRDPLAADLLRTSQATIAAVARQVGYSTPFALSSAFKRAYGVSPNTYRATASHPGDAIESAL